MTERDIEQRIIAIKREISLLGPLRPGSLSRQYNVCGNPTCRCKADPTQRHGPYYQLSYRHQGKSSSEFVREPDVAQMEKQLRNYERLRELVDEWVGLNIERGRLLRAAARKGSKSSPKLAKTRKKRRPPSRK
ncbi:MAG TPA: DUF6788 family protein [Steroidobacteraceae bacterium]|nr:DUF6788 family protein [Steroidobacteraceae bacterium]